MSPAGTLRLVHLSDPHVLDLAGVTARDFLWNKRLAGGLNLALRRSRKHDRALLDQLIERLPAVHADHVLLTGDFTNLALRPEFALARRYVQRIADLVGTARVSVTPGNHDAYTEDAVVERRFEEAFGEWIGEGARGEWPYLQLTDALAIIGCSSAVPTPFPRASGRLGARQLERLEALLTRPDAIARVRVVLVHHPPVPQHGGELRQLEDRAEFAAVIARAGADIVLHGHDHREVRAALAGPAGRSVPVIGVTSATYRSSRADRRGRFNVYEVDAAKRAVISVRAELAQPG